MPLTLTDSQREEIFKKMKTAFSDFQYFDSLVAPGLRRLIDDSTRVEITQSFTESIVKNYVDNPAQFQNKDKKEIFDKMKIILTASAVYLYSLNERVIATYFINTIEELLELYPNWHEQLSRDNPEDEKELQLLLNFRNYMKIAVLLVNAKHKKIFLLKVVERLEGSNNEYVTGTGQKPSVTRRATDIFHKESGIEMTKREENTGPRKRKTQSGGEQEENSIPAVVDESQKKAKHDHYFERPGLGRKIGSTHSDFDIDPVTADTLLNEEYYALNGDNYGESFTEVIAKNIRPAVPVSSMPIVKPATSSSQYHGSLTEEIKKLDGSA